MTDAQATGFELVFVARDFARKGGFFPTPGALVEAIRERRVKMLREERERAPLRPEITGPVMGNERRRAWNLEWNAARNTLRDSDFVPAGWTQGWSGPEAIWDAAELLTRRGHRGIFGGESIAAALDRERRDREECESRGEEWFPPVYGQRRLMGNVMAMSARGAEGDER